MTRTTWAWLVNALLVGLLLAFALALFASPGLQNVAASNPISIVVSNVHDTSFTIFWLTIVDEAGQLQVIGGGTFNDDRGADYSGATHFIDVSGLQPNTTYKFDIVSGGKTYDDDGQHYVVTTGAVLPPPTPDQIVGRVQNTDGSGAADAIVIFTVQQEQGISAPMSMLLTPRDNGFFHVNLSDLRRSQDPTRYFTYGSQTDTLTIQAVGAEGTGTFRVPTGDPRLRSKDPNQTIIVRLGSGAQTPTLVVRLPTPTPIPPVTPQETGGLVIGIGAAVLVLLGILAIGILFIWRG